MYNEQLEQLIDAALTDGELTEKEKQILFKKAQSMGVDLDEFEMVLDARSFKLKKALTETQKNKTDIIVSKDGKKSAQELSKLLEKPLSEYADAWDIDYDDDFLFGPAEVLNKLEKAEKRIKDVILNYPSPTDKEDMLDFMFYLNTQIKQSEHGAAFLAKYYECIEKIKILFPNEKVFDRFIQDTKGNNRLKVGPAGMSSHKFKKLLTGVLSVYESDKDLGDDFDSDVKSLILLFPIPSDKDDLIDFMLYLKEQIVESDFENLFKKRFNECAIKANSLYPNDNEIIRIVKTGVSIPMAASLKNGVQSVKRGTIKAFRVLRIIFKVLIILAIIALIITVVSFILDWF